MSLEVRVQRAGDWLQSEMAARIWQRVKGGDAAIEIASDALAELAIQRYSGHITNAMQRAGLPVPDGELSVEELKDAIARALDLDLPALTPDAIAAALDKRMAREVSRLLGVELTTLRDENAIREACQAAAINAIKTGVANKLIDRPMIRKFRESKAWAIAGVVVTDRRRYLQRWYQKKYRRKNKLVWDGANSRRGSAGGSAGGSGSGSAGAPGEYWDHN